MSLNEISLDQVAADVCCEMLQMSFVPTPAHRAVESSQLSGTVKIDGDFSAAVEVFAPIVLAREIAASMFGIPSTEVEEAEVFDALGEIANMIGGNVKGIAGGESQLSIPCVATLEPADCDFRHDPDSPEAALCCNGQQLFVRLTHGNRSS